MYPLSLILPPSIYLLFLELFTDASLRQFKLDYAKQLVQERAAAKGGGFGGFGGFGGDGGTADAKPAPLRPADGPAGGADMDTPANDKPATTRIAVPTGDKADVAATAAAGGEEAATFNTGGHGRGAATTLVHELHQLEMRHELAFLQAQMDEVIAEFNEQLRHLRRTKSECAVRIKFAE